MEPSASACFPVSVILWVSNAALRQRVKQMLGSLPQEETIPDRSECFTFPSVKVVRSRAKAVEAIHGLPIGSRHRILLVSDNLATADRKPTDLADEIRRVLLGTEHLAGLIALVDGDQSGRVRDVDCVVPLDHLDPVRLRRAILDAAGGLWLKSAPLTRPILEGRNAIKVRLAQSREELQECFQLRFRVYGALHYLEDEVSSSGSRLELDSYDARSLHFLAVDHLAASVVGTVRLVIPTVSQFLADTIVWVPYRTLEEQRTWCQEIADGERPGIFRRKLRAPPEQALPILLSADFGRQWPNILSQAEDGAELSRLVVDPKYQGLGISRVLIRIAIAAALDLGKDFLMLECVPSHTRMYASYGFASLGKYHCRAQDLDLRAIGMQLELRGTVHNPAVGTAKSDIRMIRYGQPDPRMLFGMKHLCLCNNTPCWMRGLYRFRDNIGCPLRPPHVPPRVGVRGW